MLHGSYFLCCACIGFVSVGVLGTLLLYSLALFCEYMFRVAPFVERLTLFRQHLNNLFWRLRDFLNGLFSFSSLPESDENEERFGFIAINGDNLLPILRSFLLVEVEIVVQ